MVTNLSFDRLYIWTRTLKSWHLNPLTGRDLRYVAHDVKLCDIPVMLVLIWGCPRLSPYWNKFLWLSTHSQHSPIGFSLIVLKEFWPISDWTTPHLIGLKFNLNLAYLQTPPNIPRNMHGLLLLYCRAVNLNQGSCEMSQLALSNKHFCVRIPVPKVCHYEAHQQTLTI